MAGLGSGAVSSWFNPNAGTDTLKIMKKVGPAFILDVVSSTPFTIILALSGGRQHERFDPLSSHYTFGGSFVNLLRCLRLIRVLYNGTNLGTGIYSFFMYIVPGAVSFYMVRAAPPCCYLQGSMWQFAERVG